MNNKRVLPYILIFPIILIFIFIIGTGCQKKTGSLDLFGDGMKSEKLEQANLNFFFSERLYRVDDIREVLDEIEKRAAKTLNIKLNFNFIPMTMYREKIKKIVASGEDCDMYEYSTNDNMDELQYLCDNGLALDISSTNRKCALKFGYE